jgi:hypothetical protein
VSKLLADYRALWGRAKIKDPTSKVCATALTLHDHARNMQLWRKEHPASAISTSNDTLSNLYRNMRVLNAELEA